jgi:MFS family permease
MALALGMGIATPAVPVYAKSFDVTFGVAALVLIVYELGGAVGTVPTGFMIDRIGRRKVLLAGPILAAISSLLIVQAGSFPELLVYRFIGGWARQMWMLSRLTMIADTGAERQRGREVTGLVGMESAGRLLGPAVGGYLAATWGITVPFVAHAVLSLMAIAPSFVLTRETAPDRQAGARADTGSHVGRNATLAALLTIPVLMFFAAQLLTNLTRGSLTAGTTHLYAVYVYGVGPEVIGALAAAGGVIGIPIIFSTGHIMDRFGRTATAVPAFVIMGLALLFMAGTAYLESPFSYFVAAFILVQVATSMAAGNMQVIGSLIAPANVRGRFFGIWRLIGEGGSTLSPVMFAVLAETLGYTAAFLSLSVSAFGGAALLFTQVRTALRRVEETTRAQNTGSG